jgi:tetratricopeptide (TPR) repeat protein
MESSRQKPPFRWLWLALLAGLVELPFSRAAKAEDAPAYPFHTRPLVLLGRLDGLRKLQAAETGNSAGATVSKEALDLLATIDRGQTLDEQEMASAYLIASGVYDAKELVRYRKQFDELTAAARRATANAETQAERGEALLAFLHAGVMSKGYEAAQTSLSEIFETGKYNCVSATVLYQIVGRRLGLNVQAVSIPGGIFMAGHAMNMLVENERRIDVETTNAEGFDFQERLRKSGGTIVGLRADPKEGHDVSDLGLASLISQNRVLALEKAKRPADAIETALIGLVLDPRENAKANNFLAVTNKWALALCEAGKFERSLEVLDLACQVLPGDRDLRSNCTYVWQKYAEAELKAGREREAVAVLRRGAKALPEGRFVRLQGEMFIHAAIDLKNEGKWDEAIALLERSLPLIDESPASEVRQWIVQIYNQRADTELKADRIDSALAVYAQAWTKWSDHRDLKEAVAFFAQKSLPKVVASESPERAAELLARLRREFPTVEDLKKEGQLCAERAVFGLTDEGKFTDAVAAADSYAPLASGPEGQARLFEIAYNRWARSLADKKDWEGALDAYAKGLARVPENRHLSGNAVATWNSWARESIAAKNWSTAIALYQRALAQFPSDGVLKNNLAYCQEQQAREKR